MLAPFMQKLLPLPCQIQLTPTLGAVLAPKGAKVKRTRREGPEDAGRGPR